MSDTERVAMFIDFENLVYGVENNEHNNESEALDVDIQRLVRFARDEGRLVFARAYADWRSLAVRQHQRDLYMQGIETVEDMARAIMSMELEQRDAQTRCVPVIDRLVHHNFRRHPLRWKGVPVIVGS